MPDAWKRPRCYAIALDIAVAQCVFIEGCWIVSLLCYYEIWVGTYLLVLQGRRCRERGYAGHIG